MTTTTIFCHSCQVTGRGEIRGNEGLFKAKARLRFELADKCPRQHCASHHVACPMRGESEASRKRIVEPAL